jgi:exonuclease SbcD
MDFLKCFEAVVNYALENRPDLFLIAGDLFDHMQPRNPTRAQAMNYFRTLHEKGIKVFLISGHHDTPKSMEQGSSPISVYNNSKYVTYFQDASQATQTTLKFDRQEVVISGISYNPTLTWGMDPLEKIKLTKSGDINILMLHYPIEGFKGYGAGLEPTVRPKSIPEGLQLVAAGHLHQHQRSKIKGTEVIFPGSTEHVRFSEEGEDKGFVWIDLNKKGVSSTEFIETPARELRTVDLNLPKKGNISGFLKEELSKLQDPELVLRIKLVGNVDVKQLATYRRSDILSFAHNKFFALIPNEKEINIKTVGLVEPLPRTTPLQEIRRYFHQRIEKAEKEEEQLLLEALKLCEKRLEEAGAW